MKMSIAQIIPLAWVPMSFKTLFYISYTLVPVVVPQGLYCSVIQYCCCYLLLLLLLSMLIHHLFQRYLFEKKRKFDVFLLYVSILLGCFLFLCLTDRQPLFFRFSRQSLHVTIMWENSVLDGDVWAAIGNHLHSSPHLCCASLPMVLFPVVWLCSFVRCCIYL